MRNPQKSGGKCLPTYGPFPRGRSQVSDLFVKQLFATTTTTSYTSSRAPEVFGDGARSVTSARVAAYYDRCMRVRAAVDAGYSSAFTR